MSGPLMLLADSQPLFSSSRSGEFRETLKCCVAGKRGVYIGAANGDQPEFFELATAAFSEFGATLAWQQAHAPELDADFDFYVLAGGDVPLGWRYIGSPRIRSALDLAHQRGALMLGVSAGAMHLASAFVAPQGSCQTFLGYCPAAVAVHEEREGWPTRNLWQKSRAWPCALLCISMGAAVVWVDGKTYATGQGVQWLEKDGSERDVLPVSSALGRVLAQSGRSTDE